jgi:hypothetical protein
MLPNSGIKLHDSEADAIKAIAANGDAFRDKTGDIARQLAFAGIAAYVFPLGLSRALALLVLCLALDAFEHSVGTIIWTRKPSWVLRASSSSGLMHRLLFTVDKIPSGHRNSVSRPVRWLFWLKVASLLGGYSILLAFMAFKTQLSR